ncbi:hypothetical protein AX15_001792 [Amanita polypyramis BW_CC]|nr:hypothetical protein AX15_001792 [Amanita polypyramis BW_CC]
MFSWFRALITLVVLSYLQIFAHAFSFTVTSGTPAECENLTINWQGGTAPFQLHLVPAFDIPRNISIPPTAFNNGKGAFTLQLPLHQPQQFVMTMSDAGGFGTGGTSDVLTVGPSQGGKCDTKSPGIAFTYQLNTALQQCRPFTVSDYSTAAQPISFYGVIPLGQVFAISPPPGSSFNWTANVATGTNIIFFVVDAQGRQGGASDILRVGNTNDASCLNKNSPSLTASTMADPTHSPTPTRSPNPSATSKPGGISVGGIAATLIGVVLFLAVVITIALFFFRRRQVSYTPQTGFQRQFTHEDQLGGVPKPHPYTNTPTHAPSASAYTLQTGSQYNVNPFDSTSSVQYQSSLNTYQPYSTSNVGLLPLSEPSSDLSNPHTRFTDPPNLYLPLPEPSSPFLSPPPTVNNTPSRSLSSSNRAELSAYGRNEAGTGTATHQTSTRYIVHTDVDDDLPPPDEVVVELPPQYSERRAPFTVVNPTTELAYDHPPSSPPPKS